MKNRKGFTIVELVIVIAVIAILAAVLIPTFAGVVGNANASAAQQEAKTALTNALAMSSNASLPANTVFIIDHDGKDTDTVTDLKPDYRFDYNGNKLEAADLKDGNTIIVLSLTAYDRLIISDKAINNNNLTNMVASIIKTMFGATNVSFSTTDATALGYYTVTITNSTGNATLKVYTCGDYETNIVTFVSGINTLNNN